MTDKKTRKNEWNYLCEICDYKCSYNSDYTRHLTTRKHKILTNTDKKNETAYMCLCGKMYKHRQSFHSHKKKCKHTEEEICEEDSTQLNNTQTSNDICALLIEQQKEHKKEIDKLTKHISQISIVTNNTHNTTTNNNKFNLNFFLNTQCKDAMSIQSFMENLQLGCKELEHMGDVGYLTGMIDIFNTTLGNMDIYKRPLHCTDLKREVLYFKQGTDWEKDSDDKQHLKKLIKNVESKNYHNLQDWQNDHPDSRECDTRENQHYMKIATEALGGADSNKDSIYLTKIMKHILKDVQVKPQ
jgi:hypothetical protein